MPPWTTSGRGPRCRVPGRWWPTLTDLRAQYGSKGGTWRQHQRRVLKASYTNHFRRGIIIIALVCARGFRRTTPPTARSWTPWN